jgi:outer membrane lipoprotein carrier protein
MTLNTANMLLPWLVLAPGPAPQQSAAEKAIDAAVASYAQVRTARATFEQTITNALTGSTLTSNGEFEQTRPDKFIFRFAQPKGDVIVSDGKYVWLYLPSSAPGQVIRSLLGNGSTGSLDLIGEFFTNPRERYAIADAGTATIGRLTTRVVSLAPKSTDAAFMKAKVWIDTSDGSLVQFQAEEPSGVTRLVRITAFIRNASVDPAAFTFLPPKGVRVVDGGSLGARK